MNALRIHGGRRLTGEWRVHSAKNAVLPIMAASILTGEATRLEGCPELVDVAYMADILRTLGCRIHSGDGALTIDPQGLNRHEMPDALAVADVVLSRAGSNTLSELLALHKPMLLVPYPLGASRGDQIENAKSYARQGLARVLMQEDMTARTLTDALFKLLDERSELLAALEAYPVKDGTQAVLKLIEDARKIHSGNH